MFFAVQPLLFGANKSDVSPYPHFWSGQVDSLLEDDDSVYVSTLTPSNGMVGAASAGNGIAHIKCVGSLKFPGTFQSDAKVLLVRLTVRRNIDSWQDTDQLRTGLDLRAYLGTKDLRYAKVVSTTPKLGSDFEYWDFYWESPIESNTLLRIELYGYILAGINASSQLAYTGLDVAFAKAFYGTADEIAVPDVGTVQAFYPLDYNTFVTTSPPQQGLTVPPYLTSEARTVADTVPALPAVSYLPPAPPSPPSPPSPPISAPSPPRGADGRTLAAVPFRLSVQPTILQATVDRSGLYSGEFDVSLHVRPGGQQGRTYRVTDQVTLNVLGSDTVQKIVKASNTFDPGGQSGLSAVLTPNFWAVKTGYIHRKTGKILLQNFTNKTQNLLLRVVGDSTVLGQGSQSTVSLETSYVVLTPGESKTVLYALTSNSAQIETEVFRFTAEGSFGAVLAQQDLTISHNPENLLSEDYYLSGPSEYVLTIGSAVNLQLSTMNGPQGTERWRVADPTYLIDHNVSLSPSGWLSSEEIAGPVSMANLMVVATTTEGPGKRKYAARMLTLKVEL